MARMNVVLELHAPGLDLHSNRITKHRLFMDVVHEELEHLAVAGRDRYLNEGRGALYVSADEWKRVIRGRAWVDDGEELLNMGYLTEPLDRHDLLLRDVGPGLEWIIRTYDPETSIVLFVQHPPGEQVSVYWLRTQPPASQVHDEYGTEG